MSAAKGLCVGIDLGTTWSCVAYASQEGVTVLDPIPSIVSFHEQECETIRLLGEDVRLWEHLRGIPNAEHLLYDSKRMIGKSYEDLDQDLKNWPFKVVDGRDGRPFYVVQINREQVYFSPEQVSAMVLTKVKKDAEQRLGAKISSAVITVPAYFNDLERQSTRDAGKIAGIKVLQIINEPTAAAIAYGLDKMTSKETNVLIFDLGGGTFDVTILSLKVGGIEVLATCGDCHLGGQDFDNLLMDHFIEQFQKVYRDVDLRSNPNALHTLRRKSESLKKILSDSEPDQQHYIEVNFGSLQPVRLGMTRSLFEEMLKPELQRMEIPLNRALQDSKLSPQSIHEVVLVGGSSRLPCVQRFLSHAFKSSSGKLKVLNNSIDPDRVVAHGAALQAFQSSQYQVDLGYTLMDVVPLSIGIEVQGGLYEVIILRNTKVPCSASDTYTTSTDNQSGFLIRIYQGEKQIAAENTLLGEYKMEGIPPMPKGVPKLKIKFSVDIDGMLKVSMKELKSKTALRVSITGARRLRQDQIQSFVDTEADLRLIDVSYNHNEQKWLFPRTKVEDSSSRLADHMEVLDMHDTHLQEPGMESGVGGGLTSSLKH